MSNTDLAVQANNDPSAVPFSAGSGLPTLLAPENACDCHMHVYDRRCPVAPGATLTPPDASVEDYRRLQRRLGTSRVVVVTPSTYGTDNSLMLDAVAQLGECARGIAVVDQTVSDNELARLHQGGVRGLRFNLARGNSSAAAHMEPLAARIAALGWHIQLLMPPARLVECEALLKRLPVHIVFDHFGRIDVASGTAHPACNIIRDLLDSGKAWVKLSGAYLLSQEGAPGYGDIKELAKAYIHAAPDRIVWGSDWPHAVASMGERPMPDDARLLDLLLDWTEGEAARTRILVDNPAVLYEF
jgi:predicted TIM-barrel fold metal-dependent hydrolase